MLKITFNSIIFYCTMIFRMLLLDSSHFLYSSRRNPSVSQSTYLTTTLDFSVFLPLQYVCYLSSFNHQNNKVMFFELEIIWNANPRNTFKDLFRLEKPCTYCSNPTAKKYIQRFSCLPSKPNKPHLKPDHTLTPNKKRIQLYGTQQYMKRKVSKKC